MCTPAIPPLTILHNPSPNTNHTTASSPQRSGPDGVYFVDLEIFGPGHSTGGGLAGYSEIPDGGNRDGAQPDNGFVPLLTAQGNDGFRTWDDGVETQRCKSRFSFSTFTPFFWHAILFFLLEIFALNTTHKI